METFSIFSTLKEAVYLWVRNFWYIALLSLLTGSPDYLLRFSGYDSHHPGATGYPIQFYANELLGFFLNAVNVAAILGLLRRQALDQTAWQVVSHHIRVYTWTLVRLYFLIVMIVLVFVIIIAGILKVFGPNQFLFLISMGFYLVFIKYALADPLVVVEDMGAREALTDFCITN
jgi:Ca2+/Na+ antiporter